MIALIARLSSPARHILLLSTCLLLIFGSTTPNVYAASQTKCVKASLGLRVRSGPGTQYWKKAGLPYGTQVTVNYTQGRCDLLRMENRMDVLFLSWKLSDCCHNVEAPYCHNVEARTNCCANAGTCSQLQ